MRFAPRLHPYLVEYLWTIDDGERPVAELWRDVAREAERVGCPGPGYHTVRRIIRAERERRTARNEALLTAVTEVPRYAPDGFRILDALATARSLRRPGRNSGPRSGA